MKNLFLASIGMIMIALTSCSKDRISGSGAVTADNRQVNNFTSVRSKGSTKITIAKGNAFEVKVQGYQNLLPYFETKLVNGALVVGYKDHVNVRNSNLEVSITMPVLNALAISGSGNITTTGKFTGASNFETEISGSGNITLEQGDAKNFSSHISGSGDVHAFGFTAEKANVEISGSGSTRITASAQLNVRISGSGHVYYKGSPDITSNISGSGGVVKQ